MVITEPTQYRLDLDGERGRVLTDAGLAEGVLEQLRAGESPSESAIYNLCHETIWLCQFAVILLNEIKK